MSHDPTPRPPRRRPLKVAVDRDPTDLYAALHDSRARAGAALDVLVAVLYAARGRLTRRGVGRLPLDGAAVDTLIVLTAGTVLVEQLQARRWSDTDDAILAGATGVQIGEALALDVDEVQAGMTGFYDARPDLYPDEVRDARLAVLVGGA